MLQRLKKKVKKRKFQNLWRKVNHHNMTTPVNEFDIKKVVIGKGTYGPIEVFTWGHPEEKLIVGNFCSIANGVKFVLGGNHFFGNLSNYPWPVYFGGELPPSATKGPIIIEDGVWIGMEAMILSGVTIGKGSIIGARSLIAKDVPPYAIVAGNPGKIVKYRFEKEIVEKLLNIDYYNKIDGKFYSKYEEILNMPLSEALVDLLIREFS